MNDATQNGARNMSQRDNIIDSAMQMFVNQGIKSVRMDDIAQELGVSKRTLYEMFGDKEELLYLCLQRHLTLIDNRVSAIAAAGNNLLEAVLIGFLEVTQYSETNSRIMGNLRKFYPSVHERLNRETGRSGSERFKQAIERCVEQGFFDKNANIDIALTMLYYMAIGIVSRKDVILPEGVSARKAFINIVILFFRGISTPCGMSVIDGFAQSEMFGRYMSEERTAG